MTSPQQALWCITLMVIWANVGGAAVLLLAGMNDVPDSTTVWMDISTNNRAMVNLTEKFGKPKGEQRRIAWLKTTIGSVQPPVRSWARTRIPQIR